MTLMVERCTLDLTEFWVMPGDRVKVGLTVSAQVHLVVHVPGSAQVRLGTPMLVQNGNMRMRNGKLTQLKVLVLRCSLM